MVAISGIFDSSLVTNSMAFLSLTNFGVLVEINQIMYDPIRVLTVYFHSLCFPSNTIESSPLCFSFLAICQILSSDMLLSPLANTASSISAREFDSRFSYSRSGLFRKGER